MDHPRGGIDELGAGIRAVWQASVVLAAVLGACESVDPALTRHAPAWHIEPRLAIGAEAGDPVFEFGRVANAVQLSDGRIAVADGDNMEVRLFTAEGGHDLSFGRRGAGPGEFTSLTRLCVLPGDTLLAGGNSRLARYAPDGRFLSEERRVWTEFSRPPYHVEYAWPLAGGTFLLMLLESSAGHPAEHPLHRSTKMYLVVNPDRALLDSLGIFLAFEQMSFRHGPETGTAFPLFPADTRVGVADGYVVIGDLDADSVLLYDLASRRRTWIELPLGKQPIPPAALAAARARACAWASADALGRCEAGLRHLPTQTHYPVFRDIAVDSLGIIWVSTFPDHETSDSATWIAVDKASRPIGTVLLPSDLRLTRIGRNYILGIARDSLGIERVQQFHLSRDR